MSAKTEDEQNRRKAGEAPTGTNNSPACDQCRTRKIRCDRESPSCSNCRKANLPCDFTNKGKRINHTKQLVEDFSFLSGRLESIDASIARITQRLELDSLPPGSSPSPTAEAAVPNDDLNHFTKHSSSTGAIRIDDTDTSKPHLTARHKFFISRDVDGGETYHGPTAGRALFQQTRFFVEDLLDTTQEEADSDQSEDFQQLKYLIADNPTAKTELRKCSDAFPFSALTPAMQSTHDSRIVSRPPQSFVESSLDFFLEEINTVLPLFDPDHLRSVVREQYGSTTRNSVSDAWNLCFNNIVVLVMGTKLKTALSMNVRRRDLEDDIFLPFLANSHRAFNSLAEYLSPRLVNVQALLTLALVAADHFQQGVFEALVHRACALGREMGLERYLETARPGHSFDLVERRRVFWSLYVLDKKRTFLTGQPCDLYLAESDLETPKFVQDEMWAKNALARIHMMSIWEEIWKNLYSSRAMRNSAKFRDEQIDRLRKYLKAWVTHHKPILERPEQVELGNATCMRLELRYSFHVAQIFVHRCLNKPDNLQQQINNARAALKIIKDISQGPATISGISLLARLLRTYPVLPFYEIHKRTLLEMDDESREDMELMRTCIDAIRIFHSPTPPPSYYNRLSAGLEWCMGIATIVRSVQERSRGPSPMLREGSADNAIGSPLSRRTTGKRDSESVEDDDDVITPLDPRSQRRRMTTQESAMSSNPMSGVNTADTSQNGSEGPDTPASGYFTDFNNIDPFSVDRKLSSFPMAHFTTPVNGLADLTMPPDCVPDFTTNNTQDGKEVFNVNNFAFSYPTPFGTVNPSRTTTANNTRPPSRAASPRNNSTDLSSIVARLPPGSQQALTSVPPSATFTPESFSAFNTDLLDDSFTNVGHHPDLAGQTHPVFPSQHYFEFGPDQMGFGHMDAMMSVDGI